MNINDYGKRVDVNRIFIIFIIVYSAVLLFFYSVNKPVVQGEWDDYTLPIASILNDHNFTIDDTDIEKYKMIFPDWAEDIDNHMLSGLWTKDGSGELTWYYPVYAIVCTPLTLLLGRVNISTIYAFPYTNLILLIASIITVYRFLEVEKKKKVLMTLILSLNPIVFYVGWASGEVFIYAMLTIGLMFWYNRMYKRAAFFVSLAGMLNPTVMSVGFFMIGEYLYRLFLKRGKLNLWDFIRKNTGDVIKYGCCYIIGIVPMIYNFYHVGHINLTASTGHFTNGTEPTFARFIAYLLDLNYGILPYFFIIFIFSLCLLILSVMKRKTRYIEWYAAFLLNMLMYSIMTHINSGMSGISRYNAWGVLLLLFAVILFYDEIIVHGMIKRIIPYIFFTGALITGVIVVNYGIVCADKAPYDRFTPIAEWALDTCPSVYNPLHSTFNSRVSHVDGGYWYDTPVVYQNKEGIVRKILVKKEDFSKLKEEYVISYGPENWFDEAFKRIGDDETYINCPKKYRVVKAPDYELGRELSFVGSSFDAGDYVISGLGTPEEWGTWTEGNEFIMRFRTNSDTPIIHGTIKAGVFNEKQTVEVYVNGIQNCVFTDFPGGTLEFEFENPGPEKPVEVKLRIPNAASPLELGYNDGRVLGLVFTGMIFTGK